MSRAQPSAAGPFPRAWHLALAYLVYAMVAVWAFSGLMPPWPVVNIAVAWHAIVTRYY